MAHPTYERIYKVVAQIPRGRVATYGQVADLAGLGGARQVGYALYALTSEKTVPWHRVINARGEISRRAGSDHDELQRVLLEHEGVRFNDRGRVPLDRYRWKPRRAPLRRRSKARSE